MHFRFKTHDQRVAGQFQIRPRWTHPSVCASLFTTAVRGAVVLPAIPVIRSVIHGSSLGRFRYTGTIENSR